MADATLEAHVEEWERTTGMKVSVSSMCRALQRLKQTRKKTFGAQVSGA
jgi:transposase